MSRQLRVDRLLGRKVMTANNRFLGRLEEFRAEQQGSSLILNEYLVGTVGLLERLGIAFRMLLGLKHGGGYVVRWDQLDLSNPHRPRLTCRVEDLRRL